MDFKQKYYLTNYATPAELIARLAEGREYLLNRRKKILLYEIPCVLQRQLLDINPETKHLKKIERIWDTPVVDGEEACIVYTPIDISLEIGGDHLESKESEREMKMNGSIPHKTIFMSRDTKVKFDLRQRVFEEWQLIANICTSALNSKNVEANLKERLTATKELAGTIMAGVSADLDYWLEEELEKQGVGKSAGYLMINLDPTKGIISVVKSPPPLEADADKLSAIIDERQHNEKPEVKVEQSSN